MNRSSSNKSYLIRKKNKRKFIFLYVFLTFQIFSEPKTQTIKQTSIFDPDQLLWSNPVDIILEEGKISSVLPSKDTGKIEHYATRGFCDAYVTISANSNFGESSLAEKQRAVQSFLRHGFVRVESVGDSQETRKNFQPNFPIHLSFSEKPIVIPNEELSDNPKNFHIVNSKEEVLEVLQKSSQKQNRIFLFSKSDSDNIFLTPEVLYELNQISESKGAKLIYAGFGDPSFISHVFTSGGKYIFFGIPDNTYQPLSIRSLKHSPMLVVAYFFRKQNTKDLKFDFQQLQKNDPTFKEFYSEFAERMVPDATSLDLETQKLRDYEYESYFQFLKKNPELLDSILFGSGAGHFFSFPGVSAVYETFLWEEAFGDGYQERKKILKSLVKNTCEYLGEEFPGKITKGAPADLLVFKENPTLSRFGFFKIDSVFVKGRYIEWKNAPKKKK